MINSQLISPKKPSQHTTEVKLQDFVNKSSLTRTIFGRRLEEVLFVHSTLKDHVTRKPLIEEQSLNAITNLG